MCHRATKLKQKSDKKTSYDALLEMPFISFGPQARVGPWQSNTGQQKNQNVHKSRRERIGRNYLPVNISKNVQFGVNPCPLFCVVVYCTQIVAVVVPHSGFNSIILKPEAFFLLIFARYSTHNGSVCVVAKTLCMV